MILKKDSETINHPCREWRDDTGKIWGWPTVEFFTRRGFVVVPEDPHLQTDEEINAGLELSRRLAFSSEADPLYFGWRRGENTEAEWLAKCSEIRERFPYI